MQIGLVLKPGPQEPWTPYRMAAASCEAGVPREAISIYPGAGEMGAEVVNRVRRTKIFGSTETVKRYEGKTFDRARKFPGVANLIRHFKVEVMEPRGIGIDQRGA